MGNALRNLHLARVDRTGVLFAEAGDEGRVVEGVALICVVGDGEGGVGVEFEGGPGAAQLLSCRFDLSQVAAVLEIVLQSKGDAFGEG